MSYPARGVAERRSDGWILALLTGVVAMGVVADLRDGGDLRRHLLVTLVMAVLILRFVLGDRMGTFLRRASLLVAALLLVAQTAIWLWS